MSHARSPLTGVRSKTPRAAALKACDRGADTNLVGSHARTTDATAGAAA
jgi:hypothetical protein